ncbi:uncharacterized protein LOC129010662 isoform X2 [Pongo pygmaeus]|uniref:uncharacterized protein LOC129010662 isoform X2 n=1 Tax=Pongo pygmaeus TaxID=9600 RepID=UPI00300C3B73
MGTISRQRRGGCAQTFAHRWKPTRLSCKTYRVDAPGGAERRARPAQHRAGERRAFRKGLSEAWPGSRPGPVRTGTAAKCAGRQSAGRAAAGAKVRPRGESGQLPAPAASSQASWAADPFLPESTTRVLSLSQAAVAAPSFAFVSQVVNNDMSPNPRLMFAPRCQERNPKSFSQTLVRRDEFLLDF